MTPDRMMHFLDRRSLDETQKYIDGLVAHALRQHHLVRFASAVRPFWVVVKIMPDDLRHAADYRRLCLVSVFYFPPIGRMSR